MSRRIDPFFSGILFILGSASCLSIVGLLGKLEIEDLSLSTLLFWRYFCAFLLCLLWMQRRKKFRKIRLPKSSLRLHLFRAVLVLASQYSFFYSLQRMSLLNATVLLNTGPLFIPFIDRFVLNKTVSKSSWVGVVIAFLGVLCILQPDSEIFSYFSLIGLLAGFCQGSSQLVFASHIRIEKSENNTLFLLFFCTLFSLIPYFLFLPSSIQVPSSPSLLVIVFIGLASVTSQLLRTEAYSHGTPTRLSPFFYFSVVLSGIFDWLFFNLIPNLFTFFGVFLVALGGFLKIYLHGKSSYKK